MKDELTQYKIILKTGKMYELDMATNLLKENKIPHFKRQETSAGVQFAMPFQPTQGPGIWYAIYVPEKIGERANKVLSELPIDITTNPGIWHFSPTPNVKTGFKTYAYIALVFIIIWFINMLIQLFS